MYNTLTIKSLLLSSRMNLFPLGSEVPLSLVVNCPACTDPLIAVCALRSPNQIMRIGFCEKCGYFGYMDRPDKEWMVNFYSSEWDRGFVRSKEIMIKDVELPEGRIKGSRREAFLATIELGVDKSRSVCDIGSGYGQVMKNFEIAGFTNVVGVGNSLHRAKLVQEVFDLPVVHGDFGSREVEEALKKYAPFGIMFCHHVFEHVYDPEKVVESISKLQKNGDYAVFAMPNSVGEHINYGMLYLLHLHSFNKKSLEKLFNRFGYELWADKSNNELNMTLIFKKTEKPQEKIVANYSLDSFSERIKLGLGLDQYTHPGLYTLRWWQEAQGGDWAKAGPISKIKWIILQIISYIKSRLLQKVTAHHIILVQPEKKNLEFPSEIWFDKEILLLTK